MVHGLHRFPVGSALLVKRTALVAHKIVVGGQAQRFEPVFLEPRAEADGRGGLAGRRGSRHQHQTHLRHPCGNALGNAHDALDMTAFVLHHLPREIPAADDLVQFGDSLQMAFHDNHLPHLALRLRTSQPDSVTTTRSSIRTPSLPGK